MQDYQGAILDYSKAIELDPKDAATYSSRGIAKSDIQDYQGTISDYSKAIELDPKDAATYYNRGIV
jgi:tetratricopeptide (TPR) repeat protein